MKITKGWLKKWEACPEGVKWFLSKKLQLKSDKQVMEELIATEKLDWANWVLARLLKRKQQIQYTIFAAEQVIDIFEKQYPNDNRPRNAIEAAKIVLKRDTKKNRDAATYAAADASAYASADAMKIRILNYGIKLLEAK